MDERIRTTHVGSLPRPPALLERLEETTTGERLSDPAIETLVREATERVVRKQAAVGIDIANNGEQARTGFHLHVTDRLSGFGAEGPAPFWGDVADYPAFAETAFEYPDSDPETGAPLRPTVTEPIEYVGEPAARREIEIFTDALEAVDASFDDCFLTAPSPGIVAASLPNQYYPTYTAYVRAVGDALAEEWGLIADAGYLLQIDAPELLHTHHRTFPEDQGPSFDSIEDYREVLGMYIDTINSALPSVPADRIRLHTCWGNYEGPHHLDVSLEDVLPQLLELEVGGLSLELSSPRHEHEYEAFDSVSLPADMTILPGVIDVKTDIIDHPKTVANRIERVVDVIGDPGRVIATPDCGFGTLAWSAAADEIAWAKLESLVEGAALASERL